jgi:serine/threonine-protein kinase
VVSGSPGRPDRVDAICLSALEQPPAERAAFIQLACGDDESLRAEVEALLVGASAADRAFEEPLGAVAAQALSSQAREDGSPLSGTLTGRRIDHLEIGPLLGVGGMGQVYRARDVELQRDVALKVLPPEVADDPDRLARFAREARVLASLSHPNIAAIYGVARGDGMHGLVLELVEGETLSDRLTTARHSSRPMHQGTGGVAVREALSIARQIALALEAAHERGIVHRDLKPANIRITSNGTVKVLDFGLAKAMDSATAHGASNPAHTELTSAGVILGTMAYMAPEQAKGQPVDRRADLWAFGCVLFELLTGHRAFDDDSLAAVLLKIVSEEPDWHALPAATPAALRRLLRRCLEKDPKRRLDSAAVARLEIDDALESRAVAPRGDDAGGEVGSDTGSRMAAAAQLHRRSRFSANWLVAAALATLAAASAWVMKPVTTLPISRAHLTIDLPAGAVFDPFTRPVLDLSADGQQLVYGVQIDGKPQLFLRRLDQLEARAVADTDEFPTPFFSPDGNWVGFRSGGALRKVAVGGGASVVLAAENGAAGASWGADGSVVFSPGNRTPLFRVPATGGDAQVLTRFDETRGESSHRFPEFLPSGKAILFTAGPPATGPWHEAEIVAQVLGTGERRTLIEGAAQAHYLPPGYLVYSRSGTLYSVAFDEKALRVAGPPRPVLDGVRENPGHGAAQFAVSSNGTLAYITGGLETNDVVWLDRQGRTKALMPEEHRFFSEPRLSPDGKRLAVVVGGGEDAIFVYDLQHDRLNRVTTLGNHTSLAWHPDGDRITSVKSATREIVSTWVDGSRPEEVLYTPSAIYQPGACSWSPDGRSLVFTLNGDIWMLTLPDRRAEPLIQSPFTESAPTISFDGKWLAYVSNESGRAEVYVRPFRGSSERWQISRVGGSAPAWAKSSQRLYFRQGSMFVSVSARPPFADPVELFNAPWAEPNGRSYVAPDGEGFVFIRPHDPAAARLHVILNWTEELKRLVPRLES